MLTAIALMGLAGVSVKEFIIVISITILFIIILSLNNWIECVKYDRLCNKLKGV
jgi:hypothetical protein